MSADSIDPNHVPEILATGPCNAYVASKMMMLTFTTNRPNPDQLFAGKPDPQVDTVVVARLMIPLDNAPAIADLVIKTQTKIRENEARPANPLSPRPRH
jgi:hypothetical protein